MEKDGGDTPMLLENGDEEDSSQFSMSPREQHDQEGEMCLRLFESWTQVRQTEFVEQLIARMSFHQHEHLYSILMPMLQRDFVTVLPSRCPFRLVKGFRVLLEKLCVCVCVRGGGGGGRGKFPGLGRKVSIFAAALWRV